MALSSRGLLSLNGTGRFYFLPILSATAPLLHRITAAPITMKTQQHIFMQATPTVLPVMQAIACAALACHLSLVIRRFLPVLKEGAMFSTRGGLSRLFTGGEQVWLQYDASEQRLGWKSLRLERNKPVMEGSASLKSFGGVVRKG